MVVNGIAYGLNQADEYAEENSSIYVDAKSGIRYINDKYNENVPKEVREALRVLATAAEVGVSVAGVGATAKALKGAKALDNVGDTAKAAKAADKAADIAKTHKNSLEYVGDTHVYRIKGPDGATYKIGESAQGVNAQGLSKRAEGQARNLRKSTGEFYDTQIRKTFPNKAAAREYETKTIEKFRGIYGQDKLPGNKTNR
jgi:hypothetical protein